MDGSMESQKVDVSSRETNTWTMLGCVGGRDGMHEHFSEKVVDSQRT